MDRSLEDILRSHTASFHPVVIFNPNEERLLLMDFTSNNISLSEAVFTDTTSFSTYIKKELQRAEAIYGIGGYAEHRVIYQRSQVFDTDAEPRRLHLGMDIWGKPNTRVMAPMDGLVHSFAFNNAFGDYGATIILSHRLNGISFYTLYGHLSLASIKNLRVGERIMKGDVFAAFGIPQENGQWPPHLHFQVIKNMQGMEGDYPGVCKYSEKEHYLENCPDPDLILDMMRYAASK